jgi:alpha-tubulin suppressor-like RCC1 family protein
MQIRAPLRVDSATNWVQTVAGQGHSCALKQQGSLWCWGANTASQTDEGYPLGTADVTRALMPRQVGEKSEWLSVATDTFHSCGLERGGALWCWGRNQEGQLGLGDDQSRPEPQRVAGDYVAVGVGRFFTCAVTRDEEVRCAGANNLGQLGVGDRERRDQLTQVLLP